MISEIEKYQDIFASGDYRMINYVYSRSSNFRKLSVHDRVKCMTTLLHLVTAAVFFHSETPEDGNYGRLSQEDESYISAIADRAQELGLMSRQAFLDMTEFEFIAGSRGSYILLKKNGVKLFDYIREE